MNYTTETGYNNPQTNERRIELPYLFQFIDETKENETLLEVGNVSPNYRDGKHTVLDYSQGKPNVIRESIVTYRPNVKFDRIVSISTFEHIAEFSKESIVDAFNNIMMNVLKPNGLMLFSIPAGYCGEMDNFIINNNFDKEIYLKRVDDKNNWEFSDRKGFEIAQYNKPFNNGNLIFVGLVKNCDEEV